MATDITNYRDIRQRFGIKRKNRRGHMYLIGKTGTGKSTLALALIALASQAGRFARLVADDRVELVAKGGRLLARPELSVVAEHPGGGCTWEFSVKEYNFDGKLTIKLNLFQDAFALEFDAAQVCDHRASLGPYRSVQIDFQEAVALKFKKALPKISLGGLFNECIQVVTRHNDFLN